MSDGWCEECGKKPSLLDSQGHYTYRCEEHTPIKNEKPEKARLERLDKMHGLVDSAAGDKDG